MLSGAVTKVESVAMPKLVNVEAHAQNEAAFNVDSPQAARRRGRSPA